MTGWDRAFFVAVVFLQAKLCNVHIGLVWVRIHHEHMLHRTGLLTEGLVLGCKPLLPRICASANNPALWSIWSWYTHSSYTSVSQQHKHRWEKCTDLSIPWYYNVIWWSCQDSTVKNIRAIKQKMIIEFTVVSNAVRWKIEAQVSSCPIAINHIWKRRQNILFDETSGRLPNQEYFTHRFHTLFSLYLLNNKQREINN